MPSTNALRPTNHFATLAAGTMGEHRRHFDIGAAPSNQLDAGTSPLTYSAQRVSNQRHKFQEAAEWVRYNGMTLPPNTPELKSLRNWFCFKLNQWKKGTLGADNERMLRLYGLDFSRYEALNTGNGTREPDDRFIAHMAVHYARHGTFELLSTSPADVVKWQDNLIESFMARGLTARLKAIQDALPGLRIGTWRLACDGTDLGRLSQWWQEAEAFDAGTQKCRAYLGQLHPETPRALARWARDQMRNVGSMTSRQKGFMTSMGLRCDESERARRRERELARKCAQPQGYAIRGIKDRRLGTFLGTAMLARMFVVASSDAEIMAAFAIGPADLKAVRLAVEKHGGLQVSSTSTLSKVRKAYFNWPGNPVKLFGCEAMPSMPDRETALSATEWAAGRSIWVCALAIKALRVQQDVLGP